MTYISIVCAIVITFISYHPITHEQYKLALTTTSRGHEKECQQNDDIVNIDECQQNSMHVCIVCTTHLLMLRKKRHQSVDKYEKKKITK